jgi:hypothetical protein
VTANYHITVRGHLEQRWAAWFDGLTIANAADGTSILAGPIADQAALHGVLIKIRDLGLPLLAVQLVGERAPAGSGADTCALASDSGAS